MPVVDERDVVEVLPLLRLSRDALLEQRDRLIGTAGPAGRRLAEEDRAKAVGDVKNGSSVVVRSSSGCSSSYCRRPSRDEAVAAVVLDGADPVDVGGQRVELERHALHGGARTRVEQPLGWRAASRVRGVAAGLQRHAHARAPATAARRAARRAAARHLKSRREKMIVDSQQQRRDVRQPVARSSTTT